MQQRQSVFTLSEIMLLHAGHSIPLPILSLNQLVG